MSDLEEEPYEKQLTTALRREGFQNENTGGNCRAMYLKLPHHEIYVTDGTHQLPHNGETCCIGLYSDEDDFNEEIERIECPASECIARVREMVERVQ